MAWSACRIRCRNFSKIGTKTLWYRPYYITTLHILFYGYWLSLLSTHMIVCIVNIIWASYFIKHTTTKRLCAIHWKHWKGLTYWLNLDRWRLQRMAGTRIHWFQIHSSPHRNQGSSSRYSCLFRPRSYRGDTAMIRIPECQGHRSLLQKTRTTTAWSNGRDGS